MENNLPKLADLHKNPQEAFKNDQFKTLLNQPPSAHWLKKHPLAKRKIHGQTQPAEYLPIDKIEFLMDVIFQEWKVEVLSVQVMFNSIAVAIRLHYKNPVTGEWSFHDGVGAKSVQVNQGENASNLGAIKDAAVMMALPSAKSYAIKDAAEHLGSLFGRDVNREDTVMFTGRYNQEPELAVSPKEEKEPEPELKPLSASAAKQDFPWDEEEEPITQSFFSNL